MPLSPFDLEFPILKTAAAIEKYLDLRAEGKKRIAAFIHARAQA